MNSDFMKPVAGVTLHGVGRGARGIAGAVPPVIAFGVGFGAAAVAAGLPPDAAVAMSAFVFAGSAQYAALDLWDVTTPLLPLVLLTLAINGRHVMLGATLHAYLARVPLLARLTALAVLSDANWASTQQAIARGDADVGHLLGGGLVLWSAWLVGTVAGVVFGQSLGDLNRIGIDVLMPAFFVCSVIGLAPAARDAPPWLFAAAVCACASLVAPSHWAALVGAGAGAGLAMVRDARR